MIGPAKNGYKATVIVIVSNRDKEEFKKICDTVNKLKVAVK